MAATPPASESRWAIVRGLTWLDLTMCAAFAVPRISDITLSLLHSLSVSLGQAAIPIPAGPGAFFVNLAGVFGVLWNIAMLSVGPTRLQKVDLVARAVVVALLVYYVAADSLSPVFLVIVCTECVGGVAKYRWLQGCSEPEGLPDPRAA